MTLEFEEYEIHEASDGARGLSMVGADEYLIKPFSPLQLINTIERLMPAA